MGALKGAIFFQIILVFKTEVYTHEAVKVQKLTSLDPRWSPGGHVGGIGNNVGPFKGAIFLNRFDIWHTGTYLYGAA